MTYEPRSGFIAEGGNLSPDIRIGNPILLLVYPFLCKCGHEGQISLIAGFRYAYPHEDDKYPDDWTDLLPWDQSREVVLSLVYDAIPETLLTAIHEINSQYLPREDGEYHNKCGACGKVLTEPFADSAHLFFPDDKIADTVIHVLPVEGYFDLAARIESGCCLDLFRRGKKAPSCGSLFADLK